MHRTYSMRQSRAPTASQLQNPPPPSLQFHDNVKDGSTSFLSSPAFAKPRLLLLLCKLFRSIQRSNIRTTIPNTTTPTAITTASSRPASHERRNVALPPRLQLGSRGSETSTDGMSDAGFGRCGDLMWREGSGLFGPYSVGEEPRDEEGRD